jgi:hypothetical protein|tara:strand:- start:51 stop:296 length:246 start_codon:yes stop_codon:yes gene_type:complete
MTNKNLILKVTVFSVLLNLALPTFFYKLATKDEIKPPNGAKNLSLKGQLMHMFVHHAQVPLSSSIIVGIIASVSTFLAVNI